MPKQQQGGGWSRISQGVDAGTSIGSSAYTGAKLGSFFGPLGSVAGGLIGAGLGAYSNWDKIQGFFGSSQKKKEDVIEGSNSSLTLGAVPLTGAELDDARQKDAMSFYSGMRSSNPPRRVTSSMLLAGGYGR